MKQYIKISFDIDFKLLTRNQILLCIFVLNNDDDRKQSFYSEVYGTNRARIKSDWEALNHLYGDVVQTYRDLSIKRNHVPRYYMIKIETFDKIKEMMPTKTELLTLLWLLKKYQNTYHREQNYILNNVLKETFGNNWRIYKPRFIDAMNKLKQIEYEDDTILLENYEIKDKKLYIKLQEK